MREKCAPGRQHAWDAGHRPVGPAAARSVGCDPLDPIGVCRSVHGIAHRGVWRAGLAARHHDGWGREFLVSAHRDRRSEEHTSELQSLMRISYAVFCLKKKKTLDTIHKNKSHGPETLM